MERRLAAIVAADMVGYGRLMAADELGTIERQKAYRKSLIDPKIAEHIGRIVRTTGPYLFQRAEPFEVSQNTDTKDGLGAERIIRPRRIDE